jgi:XTP/dITP diphosphohydrolase
MQRLVLATNNPGKVRELRRLLAGCGWAVVTPAEAGVALDVAETGATYTENALLKARAFADATGTAALADDSGIEVDALEGAPGVLSARFGGADLDDRGRREALLEALRGVPPGKRGARYRAVVSVAQPGGEAVLFEGVQEGAIACAPAGCGGFGYDPIFLAANGRTVAQLDDEDKDAISHRGKAMAAAAAWLREHA